MYSNGKTKNASVKHEREIEFNKRSEIHCQWTHVVTHTHKKIAHVNNSLVVVAIGWFV
jgi:hypothetical protein